MYKSFFGLTRNPFDLTPDPTCFVPTTRHNEALAALYYGIRRHKGVVVVTGEVGTGKTLLLRCLLRLFKESKEISYAYLFNCLLSPTEFLYYTLSDFGVTVSSQNKSKLLLDLSKFVSSRGLKGLTTVLIVDEAHLLSTELLEEIRLLSNLETNDDKLLQIVLVGQPELNDKLDSFEHRPLKQRIALRAQLTSLDADETERYISERLRIAGTGTGSNPIFTPDAIRAVYESSRGLPRLINTVCENALITAYAKQIPSVTADLVEDVARDFHLSSPSSADAKRIQRMNEIDAEQANGHFMEMYAKKLKPNGNEVGSSKSKPFTVEAEEHESNI
jgi:general secretion pathway protein A